MDIVLGSVTFLTTQRSSQVSKTHSVFVDPYFRVMLILFLSIGKEASEVVLFLSTKINERFFSTLPMLYSTDV